jgi:DmsE family decaheme c-type cytochrome
MNERSRPAIPKLLAVLAALLPLTFACGALRKTYPLGHQGDYEKLLSGSLEADYVGQKACLAACHAHDRLASYLERSVHGQQTNAGTGMPLFDCETCHGPGSEAIARVEQEKKCDTTKFVRLQALPSGAKSLLCLKCHEGLSMVHLQRWATSDHAQAGVSCPDCHQLHKGREQKAKGAEIAKLCFSCHQETRSEMSGASRHPVLEGKMTCATCHDPHGTNSDHLLKAVDTDALCFQCHGEKTGPFLFEHGAATEGCTTTCHKPHGSPFRALLAFQEPFLCLQCHTPHGAAGQATDSVSVPGQPNALQHQRAMFTRCTNCHSQLHGTDVKSARPGITFIK